jgi:alpha-amylase
MSFSPYLVAHWSKTATGKWNETRCACFSDVTRTGHADWTSPGFDAFSAEGTGIFTSQQLAKGTRPLTLSFDNSAGSLQARSNSTRCCRSNPAKARRRSGAFSATVTTRCGRYPLRHANPDADDSKRNRTAGGNRYPPVSEVGW